MNVKVPKREEEEPTESLHDRDGQDGSTASEAQTDSPSSLPNEGHRKVTCEDIKFVQALIERCLHLYMTEDEVVTMLVNQFKLEKHFINLVWQRLEEENPDFFSAYNVRLTLKKQIILFNQLMEKQFHLTKIRDFHNSKQPSQNGHSQVNSSFGHLPQQPYFPSTGATDMDSMPYGSPYHVVDGVPAVGNFNFIQQNGCLLSREAASGNHEMNIESYDQVSYEPHEFQRSSGQSMAFGASFHSNMCNIEGFQPALDGGGGISFDNLVSHHNLTTNLTNIGDLAAFQSNQSSLFPNPEIVDIVGGSPDECDIADYFIADEVPYPEPLFGIDKGES
ncbi:uncharacterized protein LOC110696081 isoform X2 [Chenopodium quinoa]|uniref:uncharacterized protein LOC110696081 isoform X2 n=1 Tax=Chenopodium quinoa TaxID=63459 RepID=UPI000B78DEA1|nr:uncharacterized protein LOC110696081 isoform X2 [Chenopodium quinoa]XP_021729048.1 uncharacterized protein LOC110696081 isoform X2 [Chenopodium quinoa]